MRMHKTNKIALANLPPADAPWSELDRFCQLIAGPDGDPRPIDELQQIAQQVEACPQTADIDDLLTAAYFFWRRARWNDEVDAEDTRAISRVISELRRRLQS